MTNASFTVDFEPIGKRVEVSPGSTILEAARQAGLPLTADCGGVGNCGKCKVIIRQPGDAVEGMTSQEAKWLTDTELSAGYRLACRTILRGNIKIEVPANSLRYGQRLQTESVLDNPTGYVLLSDGILKSFPLSVSAASIHDLRSDLTRTVDALAADYHLNNLVTSPAAVRNLPVLLRQNQWRVNALIQGNELIGFTVPEKHPLGLAVDLGTTKIAAYLVDLNNGEMLAKEGCPNPQIGYGEDVVSRLVYSMNNPDGRKTLAYSVYSGLSDLANVLASRAGVSIKDIFEVCIVGNTAMIHLLLQFPVAQLAKAPYVPATTSALETRASDLGLEFGDDCRVYIPPCVAGYVGADLVAMSLASEIGRDERTVLGIDIGTNTEIVLAAPGRERLLALSCASGPAFEGAHIRYGMRAARGGIERVRLGEGDPLVQTIENTQAVGICGSGTIDAVAELHRVGAINSRGRFQAEFPGVRLGRDGQEYLLVPANQNGLNHDITISQHDVDEIQLAKGAIRAGIVILLEEAGLKEVDLDEVVIAGAFGSHLNLDTAINIGLLPDLPVERYRQVGNAAGVGAKQILVSQSRRTQAIDLAQRIDYVELMIHPSFRRAYARAMLFYG